MSVLDVGRWLSDSAMRRHCSAFSQSGTRFQPLETNRFAPFFKIASHCGQEQDRVRDTMLLGSFLKAIGKIHRKPGHQTPATLARSQPFAFGPGIEGCQEIADG